MRAIASLAILAARNEQRVIRACIDNLIRQGFDIYFIDNDSTDATGEIASEYLGQGVVASESLPYDGVYRWDKILRRKTEIARECHYDWVMHCDADEIRLPPRPFGTIRDVIARIDTEGYNAVNFAEFCFVPTLEKPDHDHPNFQSTMRWYYPLRPCVHHRLNLWKRSDVPVDLAGSAGHRVDFEGMRIWPMDLPMRHYLFLSIAHAQVKWVQRIYDPEELKRGWHRSRATLDASSIQLQSSRDLRLYRSDADLDASEPLSSHPIFVRRNPISDAERASA